MKRPMLVLLVALVFSSNVSLAYGDEPDAETLLKSKPVAEKGAGIARLKQAKYNAALRELQMRAELWRGGKNTLTDCIAAADRLLQSDLDKSKKRLLAHYRFAQSVELELVEKMKGGIGNSADVETARYRRIDLEIRLLEE